MNNLQCLGGITNTLQYEAILNWFFNDMLLVYYFLPTIGKLNVFVNYLIGMMYVQFLMHKLKFRFYIIIKKLDSLMP